MQHRPFGFISLCCQLHSVNQLSFCGSKSSRRSLGQTKVAKMAIGSTVYNALFKRSSTFLLTVAVGVFFFERTFDLASETLFERVNQGKLFHHMKKAEE